MQADWLVHQTKEPEKCPLAQKQQPRRMAKKLTLTHDVQIKRIQATIRLRACCECAVYERKSEFVLRGISIK